MILNPEHAGLAVTSADVAKKISQSGPFPCCPAINPTGIEPVYAISVITVRSTINSL
jgi:hypothetical protein